MKNWSWFVEPTDDAAKPPLAGAALAVAFSVVGHLVGVAKSTLHR